MRNAKYICCTCALMSNSIRCPRCGNDTEQYETDTSPAPLDDVPVRSPIPSRDMAAKGDEFCALCGGLGHLAKDCKHRDGLRNLLTRADAKHRARRFSGAPLTGFGSLS